MSHRIAVLIALSAFPNLVSAQQMPDNNFTYNIEHPAYERSKGPMITIDEAHLNFHTLEGRYSPFAGLLARDGYVLKAGTEKFTSTVLQPTKILVIANALGDTGAWVLPTRQAFSNEEVEVVEKWVKDGGSLFLIADHMPCAGAVANLAAAFGFNFVNGFAFPHGDGSEIFSRELGNLSANPITEGRHDGEKVEAIEMFTGSAFLAPPEADVITRLGENYTIELTPVAWEFNDKTPKVSGMHFVNGAMLRFGRGKVVVFGEAAMFTAQLQGLGKVKMGMNRTSANENPQLLLNIIHWLDGKLE